MLQPLFPPIHHPDVQLLIPRLFLGNRMQSLKHNFCWIIVFLSAFNAETLVAQHSFTSSEVVDSSPRVETAKFESNHSAVADLESLIAIQTQIIRVIPELTSSVVAVEGGSGVIVSETGYILTASHVTRRAGRTVVVRLADGRSASAITLGTNANSDTGALKILDKGPWPHIKLAATPQVSQGDWCIAMGYPLSFERGKPASMRIGRILSVSKKRYVSDCPIMGGDSGGPLFNLQGELIAISSRINTDVSHNIHVPIKNYQDEWNDLAASKDIPRKTLSDNQSYLGVLGETVHQRVRLRHVYRGSPAAKAGLQKSDEIISFDGKPVKQFAEIVDALNQRNPGDVVSARLNRSGQPFNVSIRLGKTAKPKTK